MTHRRRFVSSRSELLEPRRLLADTGSVSGLVYLDANRNGAHSAGEAGIAGVQVYVDLNNNSTRDSGEAAVTTNSAGRYQIDGLPAGRQKVRVDRGSYQQITPGNNFGRNPTVYARGNTGGQDFGLYQNVSVGAITGSVKVVTGQSLAGATVYIDLNNNSFLDNNERRTSVQADGNYLFSNVAPGLYKVRVSPLAGYTQRTPGNNFGQNPVVRAGQVTDQMNFTFNQVVSTGGVTGVVRIEGGGVLANVEVYIDTNNNSVRESFERSTRTNVNGVYTFGGLEPGVYKVRIDLKAGYEQVLPTNNFGRNPVVERGSVTGGADFLVAATAGRGEISGAIYVDTDRNQVYDEGNEEPLRNWIVYLDDNNNSQRDVGEQSTSANDNGYYLLTDVTQGQKKVRVERPSFWQQLTPTNNFGRNPIVVAGETTGGVNFSFDRQPLPAAGGSDDNDQLIEAQEREILDYAPDGDTFSRLSGAISTGSDVDVWRFAGSGAAIMFFNAIELSPGLQILLRVFDSVGNETARKAYTGSSGDPLFAAVVPGAFNDRFGGTVYIAISSLGNSDYNARTGNGDAGGSSTGSYRISTTEDLS